MNNVSHTGWEHMVYDGLYVLSITKFSESYKVFGVALPFMTTKHSKFLVQLFMTVRTLSTVAQTLSSTNRMSNTPASFPALSPSCSMICAQYNTHHSLATVCVCVMNRQPKSKNQWWPANEARNVLHWRIIAGQSLTFDLRLNCEVTK